MRQSFLFLLLFGGWCCGAHAQRTLYYQPAATPPSAEVKTAAGKATRLLRPGGKLMVDFGLLNYFKYKATLQVTSSLFEPSSTITTPADSPTQPKTDPNALHEISDKLGSIADSLFTAAPPTVAARIAAANAALTTIHSVVTRYQAFTLLLDKLHSLYKAEYWVPTQASDLDPDARLAFDGQQMSISAADFANQPQAWADELTSALASYSAQAAALSGEYAQRKTALNHANQASLAANTTWQKAQTAQRTAHPANQNRSLQAAADKAEADYRKKQTAASAAQTAFDEVKDTPTNQPISPKSTTQTEAEQKLVDLTRRIANEKAQWTVLAAAYVDVRTLGALAPVQVLVALPDDKDEAEIQVKLRVRDTYQVPPGSTNKASFYTGTFVKTLYFAPRFRITVSAGPYIGGLLDHKFVLADDSLASTTTSSTGVATTTYAKRRRIVRDNADQRYEYVGVTVLTHFELRLRRDLGVALSLGGGTQAAGFRALVGPSLLVGNAQRVVLTSGWEFGQVKRISALYAEGDKIPVAIQTVPTRDVITNSWFVALTYNLTGSRKASVVQQVLPD